MSEPVEITDGWRRCAAALLIVLGVALRLRTYLAGRSLRRDESMLTLNLVRRTFAGLLLPLDDDQGAPLCFLMLEKSAISVFGNNEFSLRLVPLLAGLMALPLAWVVAKRLLGPTGALIVLALVATAEPLVYYASETKQYSGDLAITLALLSLATSPVRRPWRLAIVSAVAIWFSHPSVFVLGAIGLAAFLFEPRRGTTIAVAVAWALSFLIEDRLFLRHLRESAYMQRFWAGAFMPLPPRSSADLRWFYEAFTNLFRDPLGFSAFDGLAAGLFFVGVFALAEGNKQAIVFMITPVALALVASGLRKYPFSTRLILFTAPLFFTLIAAGLVSLGRSRAKGAAVLLAVLLLPNAIGAAKNLVRPLQGEELKRVMFEIQTRRQSGDSLFVYFASEPAFRFYTEYADRPILPGVNAVIGRDGRADPSIWNDDMARLRGHGRVWCLFSHALKADERAVVDRLDANGKRLDAITAYGATAYLYEL